MRVGVIVKILPQKKVGFIRTDDFREDVFFHFSVVDDQGLRPLAEGDEVEYELNELARIDRKELRATLVRMSKRPLSMRLKASDAPELHVRHHPKARQKRPVWRSKNSPKPETGENDSPPSTDAPTDPATE
jgi:cold shock CspA family protein